MEVSEQAQQLLLPLVRPPVVSVLNPGASLVQLPRLGPCNVSLVYSNFRFCVFISSFYSSPCFDNLYCPFRSQLRHLVDSQVLPLQHQAVYLALLLPLVCLFELYYSDFAFFSVVLCRSSSPFLFFGCSSCIWWIFFRTRPSRCWSLW
jgi:hypothetical protein